MTRQLLPALALLLLPSLGYAAAPPTFDADRAYRDLVKQCEFGPRVPGTPAHERCADWLVAQLTPLADKVEKQSFTVEVDGQKLALTNIVVTVNSQGKGRVLLCAHWDTRPRAENDPDPGRRGEPIVGANDGASGVGVLLEIARALKAHPPKQQVTLVFFDGEDWGTGVDTMFLGSRYFAQQFHGVTPDWAALLDMVGDTDLRLPQEGFSLSRAPQVVARIWGAARRAGLTAFVPQRGESILDDHVLLLDRGLPCVDIIDFIYPYWHTTADTPDKCSAESLGQVGRALLEAIADGP